MLPTANRSLNEIGSHIHRLYYTLGTHRKNYERVFCLQEKRLQFKILQKYVNERRLQAGRSETRN